VAEQLAAATAQAAREGVTDVPAVRVGGRVFGGERALEDAARQAEHSTDASSRDAVSAPSSTGAGT
jgi:hypothetical protein